jgi:cbb3-type cytochrome oxidase maturation protein
MSSGIIAVMLGVSTFLGALSLAALLWGIKTGQFEDQKKFLDGAQFDGEEELRDAINLERKKKEILKKREKEGYRPPD